MKLDKSRLRMISISVALASIAMAVVDARSEASLLPSHPITIVVGSSAGSSMEFEIRILSDWFREHVGQPLQIDVRPGATGAIGATVVMRAKPDGYTLFASPASPMVFNPVTRKNLTYDPKMLTPVIEIATQPLVVVARGDFPGDSLKDLIEYAKAHPDGVHYSSPGIGGGNHMSTLLLEKFSGVQMNHVPYEGAGPATQALLHGEVDFAILSAASLLPWYRDGKLKFFAVGSPQRSADAPDVPTLLELGYPEEFILTAWRVLVGPPNMPQNIAQSLNEMFNRALEEASVRAKFKALGLDVTGGTTQSVAAMLARESATWERVARENNIEKQ